MALIAGNDSAVGRAPGILFATPEPEDDVWRTRYSWSLAIAGLLLAGLCHLAVREGSPFALIYTVAVPIVPFVTLAVAVRRRRTDGTWRYRLREIHLLTLIVATLILFPYVWWWFEYGSDHYDGGGVNFALGCLLGLIPITLPFVLILGLALAKESARAEITSTAAPAISRDGRSESGA